jgi:ABC-type glycerol-3-phosphate transport system permease component
MLGIIWSLFPIYYVVVMSISGEGAMPSRLELPRNVSLQKWKQVILEPPTIWPYMLNSLWVAFNVVCITLLVSLPAAYVFSRRRSKAYSSLFNTVLIYRMVPYISLAIPLFFLMKRYGLLGKLGGIAVSHLIRTVPLCIWLGKSFFDTIPRELEEAAWIDGVNVFGSFWRIVLPLSKSGIVVIVLFSFLHSYIELLYASIISRAGSFTLPIYFARFTTIHSTDWRAIAVSAQISLIPMVVVFVILQKYLMGGLRIGKSYE